MSGSKKRAFGSVLAALALACAVVGCGSGDSTSSSTGAGPATSDSATSGSSGGQGKLATVDMSILGISADAPIWIGIEKGYFRDQGIDLRLHVVGAGGAGVIPAVLSGQYDVNAGGVASAILAISKGLDLKLLATPEGVPIPHGTTATNVNDTEHISLGIVVPKGSDIRSLKDLPGKTVGAITLNGIQYLCAVEALDKAGVEPKSVKITEVALPEMLGALKTNRIAAAEILEPFLSQARHLGDPVISNACVEAMPGTIQGAYYVNGKWAGENPELAKGLGRALTRSNHYAESHPAAQRKAIAANTKIPPQAVKTMALYLNQDKKNTLGTIVRLMLKYGLLKSKPDLGDSLIES